MSSETTKAPLVLALNKLDELVTPAGFTIEAVQAKGEADDFVGEGATLVMTVKLAIDPAKLLPQSPV